MNILENTPNLLMLPSAVKAGKLYSILPQDGSGDFTVDRNSTATRVNKDGLIEVVPANTPRVDWSTGEPMLLVEGESTNLNSEKYFSIDNSYTKLGEETLNGVLLEKYEVVADGRLRPSNVSFVAGKIYTFSTFVKKIDISMSLVMPVYGNWENTPSATFDLAAESSNREYSEIKNLGNGLLRISITNTCIETYSTSPIVQEISDEAGTIFFAGGTQIEEGAKATSYIPTNGSIATRLADEITVTPPTGTTEIKETVDGEENVITTIPATYQIPNGNVSKIEMI